MFISKIEVKNYRNYDYGKVNLYKGLNLFVGKNGQGKTNLIEAIYYLANLESHRTNENKSLIKINSINAVIKGKVFNENEKNIEIIINENEKNILKVNNLFVEKKYFKNIFSTIIFSPEDIYLIKGEPKNRRKFLDNQVIINKPEINNLYIDYEKILKQRNNLLKIIQNNKRSNETFDIWTEKLIELGFKINEERNNYLEKIKFPLINSYRYISRKNHTPEIILKNEINISKTNIKQFIKKIKEEEIKRGHTLFGPHRDDYCFILNNLPVKNYASHGESWSYAISIKIAAAEVLRQNPGQQEPVILLDDVFSELDNDRRKQLLNSLKKFQQIIVTAAVLSDVPKDKWNINNINDGKIL